ncbi:hypothetical protein [Rhizobium leguminosarum]|uniref:hypothetical protein n=1 Tax=Rhizobium leguminosarum TaxID=384 RepID=UPI001C92705E|nr:hypothetical protein [Rhizobium leguminosarum]MBY3044845.1 hypothetical protein [Rhizobium leguminosarum]
MRALTKISIAMLILVVSTTKVSAFDHFNLTRDNYTVALSGDVGANILLGMGLNLDDPDNPLVAPLAPFLTDGPRPNASQPQQILKRDEIFSSSTAFIEDQSDYEFSRTLRANLKASFTFASGSAAYEYVKEVRKSSDVIVAIISETTTSPAIAASSIKWASEPSAEKVTSKDDRLRQFVDDYGSHYVQTIRYGFKIAIYGRKLASTEKERQEFRAAFKAAFSGGAGSAKAGEDVKSRLDTNSVELRAVVTGGKIEPSGATVFYRFDQIVAFLEGLRSGSIKMTAGPIEVTAKSYWHTLIDYPNSRDILSATPAKIEAPYGVPKGTVIAWNPPPEAMKWIGDTSVDITVPDGWALCDGTRGTPNLIDRFVLGSAPLQIGQTGGAASHSHTALSKAAFDRDGFIVGNMISSGTIFGVTTTVREESSIPPFYKLIYLMRL